jgi:hypothetical protein
MALTLTDRYNYYQNTTFRGQIASQISRYAGTVLNSSQDYTKPPTYFYKMRDLANSVIKNPSTYIDIFAYNCSSNGTFASNAGATDTEISNAVQLVFPYIAGIDTKDV